MEQFLQQVASGLAKFTALVLSKQAAFEIDGIEPSDETQPISPFEGTVSLCGRGLASLRSTPFGT